MHLLVVDPNVPFATLLAEELGRLGHEVTLCADGGAALQSAQSAPPDVAFLDMALAGPDARTLAHQLRALDPGMRLVLIPLMGDGPQLDDMDLPIQGILPKPFFLPDLPDHIEAALRAPLPAGVSRDHPRDGAPAIAGPEAGEVAGLEVAAHGVPDWVESLFGRTESTVELAPDEESLPLRMWGTAQVQAQMRMRRRPAGSRQPGHLPRLWTSLMRMGRCPPANPSRGCRGVPFARIRPGLRP